ncbi:MAG: flagellar biosynthesis anti-sigma factor FlgM [Phycisphaerales bacterium]|nr:MAG: flagellar biosynthesis anti-sigma factor FlgM [Phycisphaerales bacterium]
MMSPYWCFRLPETAQAAVYSAAAIGPCLGKNLTLSEQTTGMVRVRMDKVCAIRQQLAEGTYDVEGRLQAILEELLAVVQGQAKNVGSKLSAQEGMTEGIMKSQAARVGRARPPRMAV